MLSYLHVKFSWLQICNNCSTLRGIQIKRKQIMAQTTDAIKILENMIGGDRELRQMCEQATLNAHVAQLIYNPRTEAGLSQK